MYLMVPVPVSAANSRGGVNAWEQQCEGFGFQKMEIRGITIEIEIDTIYAIVWRNE